MKNQRKKQEGMGAVQSGKLWAISIAAALAAAVAVFGVMVSLEKDILTQYEKGSIYTAIKQIPKGQLITEKNYDDYFEKRELDKSCIPKTALSSPEQVRGLTALADIETGVLLTKGMFREVSEITGQMKEPVIAGFKADDLYQVVGGVLRVGDSIHIYSVRESGEAVLVWKDVFVQQVFDASGTAIMNDDEVTAAQRINVYMDKEDIEGFYSELALGSLRVVKVCE